MNHIDTLDDFTVLNIIVMCDVKTVLSALPLTCRRMYELYDDVTVIKRFRSDIINIAQFMVPEHAPKINGYARYILLLSYCGRVPVKLPLGLIIKADLGAFTLLVHVRVSDVNNRTLQRQRVFAPALQHGFQTFASEYSMTYTTPCKLTTAFGTVCNSLDTRILNNMLAPATYVTYNMRDNMARKQSAIYCRQLNGGKTMYELGFGHEYTTLTLMIYIDANLYRC